MKVLSNASCFVAGTPLLTPGSAKAIEQFRPGDLLLSRSENDIESPVEVQVVEEVFVRTAPVLTLRVRGHDIRTTAEHPFWVRSKGWCCAMELRQGLELASHDGQWVAVEAITDAKEIATVCNLRVSSFHTYFVGAREWGFSVWAHNALCAEQVVQALEKVGINVSKDHPVVQQIIAAYAEGGGGSAAAKIALRDLEGVSANQAKRGVQALNSADAAATLRPPATRPSLAEAEAKAAAEEAAGIAAHYEKGHLTAKAAKDLAINSERIPAPPSEWQFNSVDSRAVKFENVPWKSESVRALVRRGREV